MKNKAEEEIIKMIETMAGRYSGDAIFTDWVQCCALAIQNSFYILHDKIWQDREQAYLNTINKYDASERALFQKGFHLLAEALEYDMSDVLGDVYMKSGCGSKQTGQFFTPFHLSYATAALSIPKDISEENKLILNEPSAGGGGMIIAAAKVLKERGLNYQNCMKVVAQDLDWRAVYMTYVQLSLIGIDAKVIQGNTLSEAYVKGDYPENHILCTPKNMGVFF